MVNDVGFARLKDHLSMRDRDLTSLLQSLSLEAKAVTPNMVLPKQPDLNTTYYSFSVESLTTAHVHTH